MTAWGGGFASSTPIGTANNSDTAQKMGLKVENGGIPRHRCVFEKNRREKKGGVLPGRKERIQAGKKKLNYRGSSVLGLNKWRSTWGTSPSKRRTKRESGTSEKKKETTLLL